MFKREKQIDLSLTSSKMVLCSVDYPALNSWFRFCHCNLHILSSEYNISVRFYYCFFLYIGFILFHLSTFPVHFCENFTIWIVKTSHLTS